jgi:hypothetical protein
MTMHTPLDYAVKYDLIMDALGMLGMSRKKRSKYQN